MAYGARRPRPSRGDAGGPDSERPETAAHDGDQVDHERTDSQKSYVTILEQEIREGLDELQRPARGVLLSGLSGGLDIGFSVLAVGAVASLAAGVPELLHSLLRAGAYAVGFVLVVIGRSELFTEHPTIAALPWLDGRTSLRRLLRLWGLVYASNLVGVAIFAGMLAATAPALGTVDPAVLAELAEHLLRHGVWVTFASAILAGWLMGLVSWLVTAGRDTTSQILLVGIVTGLIGFAGLHHCILGTCEILAALFTGAPVSVGDLVRFLALATAGNVVGGFLFVGVVKYGHASRVRPGLGDPRHWRGDD